MLVRRSRQREGSEQPRSTEEVFDVDSERQCYGHHPDESNRASKSWLFGRDVVYDYVHSLNGRLVELDAE